MNGVRPSFYFMSRRDGCASTTSAGIPAPASCDPRYVGLTEPTVQLSHAEEIEG